MEDLSAKSGEWAPTILLLESGWVDRGVAWFLHSSLTMIIIRLRSVLAGNDFTSRKRPFSELDANTLSPPSPGTNLEHKVVEGVLERRDGLKSRLVPAGRARKHHSSSPDRCQDVAEPATVPGEEGVSQPDEATTGNGTGSHCQNLRQPFVLHIAEGQSGAALTDPAHQETLSLGLEDGLFGPAATEEQCLAEQTPEQDTGQQQNLLQPAVEVESDTLCPEVEDGHAAQQKGANMKFSATQYPDMDDEDLGDRQQTAHMEFSATQFPELVDEELIAEPAEVGTSAQQQPKTEDGEPFQQPASPSGRRLPDAVTPVTPATASEASTISEELHEFKGEVLADLERNNIRERLSTTQRLFSVFQFLLGSVALLTLTFVQDASKKRPSGKHEWEIDRETIYKDSPPAKESTTPPPEAPESEPEDGPESHQPQQFARASEGPQHLHSWLRTDPPAKAAAPARPLDRDCYLAEDADNNLPGRASKCPRRLAGT